MKTYILGSILKIPAILLLVASFFGSIYAAINKIGGVVWAVPIVLIIILILYFIGEYLLIKRNLNMGNFWV